MGTSNEVFDKVTKRIKKRKVDDRFNQLDGLEIEVMPVDRILPNTYNPNRQDEHEFNLLLKSMEEDGFTQPILISADNVIIDGEHRWRAVSTLGRTEIECARSPMTAEQARIATIRHNRARGNHSIEAEAALLKDIATADSEWAKEALQLSDAEMRLYMEEFDIPVSYEPVIPQGASHAEATKIIDRAREEELAMAKQMVNEQATLVATATNIYRLSLTFDNEEGRLVKGVLGKKRAERVLELCRKYG